MGLTMEMRKGFAREKAKRYRQGSKKKKGQLIEEYMEMAGCTRHHAVWMLRTDGAGTPNGVAIPARCPVVGRPVCYRADCRHYQHGGCVQPEAVRRPPRRPRRR